MARNKQKNQKVGLGQQPKETREERRRRIEEEAKGKALEIFRNNDYAYNIETCLLTLVISSETYRLAFKLNGNTLLLLLAREVKH